jgi:hypothetical protein
VKKNLRELYLLLFPNPREIEVQVQNQPLEENMSPIILNFYNFLAIKLVLFVVFSAKILDMFVFPCYYYSGSGLYFKISTHKTKMYPLFFNTRWDLERIKKSLKFLFSDLLKIMKMMGIESDTHIVFQKFQDFFDILLIIKRYLFGAEQNKLI